MAYFTFLFVLFVLSSLRRLVYSREGKRKGFKFLLSNGQHPTNQIQGGRNRRGQNNYVLQKLIAYQTLLFFKAKIWSAGGGRTNLPGRHGSCPLRRARKRCVCAQSLRRYAYRQSFSRHPRPCGSHSGREVLW